MDLIGVGKTVAIKINNGEQHAAYISSINNATKSVTLVWYWNGKTDSKEIPIDEISNEPVIIEKYDNSISSDLILTDLNPEISLNTKFYSDIEEFNSDTKIDSHHISKPTSNCSVLINELQENANLFNNMQISMNTSTSNDDNLDDDEEEEEENFVNDNKSIHSCHCPESQMSLKSKISNTSDDLNVANAVAFSIKTSISKSKPTINDVPSNTKISDISIDKIEATLDNAASIQQSMNFILKKRQEEEAHKKSQTNQKLKRKKNKLTTLDLGDPSKDILAMIRECKMTLPYQPLDFSGPVESHAITVCVRKRPLTPIERLHNDIDIISIPNKDFIIVHELKKKVNMKKYLEHHKFRFDYGFDETCNNETVYKYTAKPLINTIFDGGMATCFAYGQTGAGKTYTVGGNYKNGKTTCEEGICALAAKDVFKRLKDLKHNNLQVSASFYEIYNGKVYDLLSDKRLLSVLEDGYSKINIVGLTEKVVTQYNDVLHLIEYGNNIRSSGETSANKHSSRSHAVFQLILRPHHIAKIYGKFSFIDLAGNERGCDSISTNRYEMVEAAGINTSLLALKECIRAMGKNRAHLPFRASKLTQVLKDSFVAKNSKTCMIAMISPGLNSCQYTLNTLRYADRVKELAIKDIIKKHKKTNPKQNIDNLPLASNFVPRI